MRKWSFAGTRVLTKTMLQVGRVEAVVKSSAYMKVQEIEESKEAEAWLEMTVLKLRIGKMPQSHQRERSEVTRQKLMQRQQQRCCWKE